MALLEPAPVVDFHSDPPGEVSPDDVLLNSSPRTVKVPNIETAEDTKVERCQMDLKAAASPNSKLWTTKRDGEVKLRMQQEGPGSETPKTIHDLFHESVSKYSDFFALASKKGGQWVKLTYKMYYEECWKAAKSFLKLGLQRFHGVCILGFNSAEWFIADIAAILAGGLTVGIYTTSSPEACYYVAENCSANIIVVENNIQLQKILEVEHKLPHLKAIIQYGEELKDKRPNLYSWAEFMDIGKDVPDTRLNEIIKSQKPNQCCMLIYTSGTTGQPKGVMLSHDNLTWTALMTGKFILITDPREKQEVAVSYLPLSHIAAQMLDVWTPIAFGVQVFFAQPDALKGTLVNTLQEARPTAFFGVPRVWEKIEEKIKSMGSKSSLFRRKVASWAKGVGLQTNLKRINGCSEVPVNFHLANCLIYKKVRRALGLDRCSRCYSGAAPISKETQEFFLSLNIPLYEVYGMSESSGPHAGCLPQAFKLSSCGKELMGCQTLIYKPDKDGNGEICFSGRHIFMGYLNMEEKTREAIDDNGWLHSGDLGKHDKDGFLFITGRIKELLITAGGENVPPIPIENAVKEAVPIISNAMLVGDKAKFLSILLTLKSTVHADTGEPGDELTPEAVEFCRELGSKATRVSDVVHGADPAVYAAIQRGIAAVNEQAVSNAQKIQKWVILEKDFSISGGELGPTMKLKRPEVMRKYKEQIAQLYRGVETSTTPENALQAPSPAASRAP